MPRAKLGSSAKQEQWLIHYFAGGAGGLPGGGDHAYLRSVVPHLFTIYKMHLSSLQTVGRTTDKKGVATQ